jgi:predicted RNase H-like nuclease
VHCSAERFGVQTAGRQADAQQWKWCTLPAHAHAQEGVGKTLVVGVDGCPGGWLAMAYDAEAGTLTPEIHATFRAVLDAYPGAASVAIDIPIGLLEGTPQRRCDVEARKVLGFPRRTSVFRAPDPRCVHEPAFEKAKECSFRMTGKRTPDACAPREGD